MDTLQSFFLSNLTVVFFIYGLSFLCMFAVIMRQSRATVRFELVEGFLLLAGFGLLHGLTEWTDMVRLVVTTPPVLVQALAVVKLTLLAASFQFLFLFGLHVLTSAHAEDRLRWTVYLSPLLVAVYSLMLYLSLEDIRLGELLVRLTLGFVGAGLASFAFFKLAGTLRKLCLTQAASDARWVALGFGFYAIFAGLLYQPSGQPIILLGIPVQIFRAACAVLISIFVVRILSFFRR